MQGKGSARRFRADESGQVAVLVALLFTVLVGFAGLAIDAGRFYAERRNLQNAVDAAALACAGGQNLGLTPAQSIQRGRDVFALDTVTSPVGVTATLPATAVYQPNIPGDGRNLSEGIVSSGAGCRAATATTVHTYFIQLFGMSTIGVFANAYAARDGGFLPVVVQRWENPPGPAGGYHDHTKQSGNDSANCVKGAADNCPDASDANPGLEFTLEGQGAKALNDSSFRGNIVLDIREFETSTHVGYNGVAGDANPDTQKDLEAGWITAPGGYPGPDLCAALPNQFQPCAQVAVTNGNTSGVYIDAFTKRYSVGDVVMLQVYDGFVKTVSNFTIAPPTVVDIGINETKTAGNVVVAGNNQFQPTAVALTVVADPGDPANPIKIGTMTPGTLTPSSAATSFTSAWTNVATTGAAKGIYAMYVHGVAAAPFQQISHDQMVVLNVGGQTKDFDPANSTTANSVSPSGPVANYTVNLKAKAGWSTPVTLTFDSCPGGQSAGPPYKCYFNNDTSQKTFPLTPTGSGASVTASVATASLGGNHYPFDIRATGLDVGAPVTRIIQMSLDVDTASGNRNDYVDVLGYTLFRVTAVASNHVDGVAVTGMVLDPNDDRLARGRAVRLKPWETP
ncbi:MAG: pilus assembly protein TadG-related protein [Chloroflexota bacterium]|nr:pilus assembly protein TadG-related protein [Chloroflexota bacterium]